MKTTVNIPDLENFLNVVLEYSNEIGNPYMTDATQIFQEHLLGEESEDFLEGLKAFSHDDNSIDFKTVE